MSTSCDQNCNCPGSSTGSNTHVNGFLILSGIPYLLAEYMDKRGLTQIDHSLVESHLTVDNSDCMRTVVDVSIDDIGRDGYGNLNVLGNVTKTKNLVELVQKNSQKMKGQIPVIRRGIIARVFYRLENQRTGVVLRSMIEDLRVYDRGLFIDVNSEKLGDSAVIVNFSNSMVSTINHFTHGRDPMVLRITKIELYYETVKPNPFAPVSKSSLISDPNMVQYFYGCDADVYKMHQMLQNHHIISAEPSGSVESIIPSTWDMFNRFYHFDEEYKDMVLHEQEIYDYHTQTAEIACGTVQVNRSFIVNPCSRIIFKMSIWKNDLVIVPDSTDIMVALGQYTKPNCNCNPNTDSNTNQNKPCCPFVMPNPYMPTQMDYTQNNVINKLTKTVSELINIIKESHPDSADQLPKDVPATLPVGPIGEQPCPCPPPPKPPAGGPLGDIMTQLDEIQEQLNNLESNPPSCNCDDVGSISPDWVAGAVEGIFSGSGE